MIVVDASVAVKWFVNEPGRAAARGIIKLGDMLVAPDFMILEVLNVLRRKQRLNLISERQIILAVDEIHACFAELMPARRLSKEALGLSIELDHSLYDCSYLACAMIKDAKLVTADENFLKKVVQIRYAQ